jgi:hypothetical protein
VKFVLYVRHVDFVGGYELCLLGFEHDADFALEIVSKNVEFVHGLRYHLGIFLVF